MASCSTSTVAHSRARKIGDSSLRIPHFLNIALNSSIRPRRYVRRDLWRDRAIEIRVAFEKNKNVKDPRAVALLLNEAEKEVIRLSHPDPYRGALFISYRGWELML